MQARNTARVGEPSFAVTRRIADRDRQPRMRFPVAAKMALQSAGAIGGTPGSPTPPSGMAKSAGDQVQPDLPRRDVHARDLVVVEVALLDTACLEA